jgi:hypothetical protein
LFLLGWGFRHAMGFSGCLEVLGGTGRVLLFWGWLVSEGDWLECKGEGWVG